MGTETDAILNAITAFRSEVRGDIGGLHSKIEGVCVRVEDLEKERAGRAAAAEVKEEWENECEERKREVRGTWLYIVRGLALAGIMALAGIVYKLVAITDGLKRVGILE